MEQFAMTLQGGACA